MTKDCDYMHKKRIFMAVITVVCAVVLWLAVGIVDYCRLHRFEKPIFCVGINLCDLVNMSGLDIPMTLKGTLCPMMNFQE